MVFSATTPVPEAITSLIRSDAASNPVQGFAIAFAVQSGDGKLSALSAVTDATGQAQTVLTLVVRTSHHWAVHTGQIVYATRLITQAGLDELWMKTMM